MYCAVTDSNSFSHINVSILWLLTLAKYDHNLVTLCASSLLTSWHVSEVEVILYVLGGTKYDCSSVTYIYKVICLCSYLSTSFHQLGAIYNESIWYV